MNSFFHYIATDIIDKHGTDLSHIAIVFPNKRAALFLNEELAKYADKPVWAPTYLTISELFRKYSIPNSSNELLILAMRAAEYRTDILVSVTPEGKVLDQLL